MPFHTEQINRIRQEIPRAVPPNEARALAAFLDIADEDLKAVDAAAQRCDLESSLSQMLSAFAAIDLISDAGRRLKFAANDEGAAQTLFERSEELRDETVEHLSTVIKSRCFRP